MNARAFWVPESSTVSPSVDCYISVPGRGALPAQVPLPPGGALESLVGACHVAEETLAQASWRHL